MFTMYSFFYDFIKEYQMFKQRICSMYVVFILFFFHWLNHVAYLHFKIDKKFITNVDIYLSQVSNVMCPKAKFDWDVDH